MKQKINIALVSYLNTTPFLYGLKRDKDLMSQINIHLEYPSRCADLLQLGSVDISLIPVIEIPNLSYHEIVGDYCIGSEGKVNTVMLYSDCPIHEIETIALDYQSRTSVKLVKVLAKNHWGIDVRYEETSEGYIHSISGKKAGVVIGDRAFELEDSFTYKYDLSEEWYHFTGLPFVFACWVASKPLDETFKRQFNKALKFGLNHKIEAIKTLSGKQTDFDVLDRYLNESISYDFDQQKKKALKEFIKLVDEL